jgi:hypothetical protein
VPAVVAPERIGRSKTDFTTFLLPRAVPAVPLPPRRSRD